VFEVEGNALLALGHREREEAAGRVSAHVPTDWLHLNHASAQVGEDRRRQRGCDPGREVDNCDAFRAGDWSLVNCPGNPPAEGPAAHSHAPLCRRPDRSATVSREAGDRSCQRVSCPSPGYLDRPLEDLAWRMVLVYRRARPRGPLRSNAGARVRRGGSRTASTVPRRHPR
jgi:hypothetical protein